MNPSTLGALNNQGRDLAMLRRLLSHRHGVWCFYGWHHPAQLLLVRAWIRASNGTERVLPVLPDDRCDVRPLLSGPFDAGACLVRTEPLDLVGLPAWFYLRIVNGFRDRVLQDWGCPILWSMPAICYDRAWELAPDTWTGRGSYVCLPEANEDIEALLAALPSPPPALEAADADALMGELERLVRRSRGTEAGPGHARAWAALGGPSWSSGARPRDEVSCVVSDQIFGPRSPFFNQQGALADIDLSLAAGPGQWLAEIDELAALVRAGTIGPNPALRLLVPEPHANGELLSAAATLLGALATLHFGAKSAVEPLKLSAKDVESGVIPTPPGLVIALRAPTPLSLVAAPAIEAIVLTLHADGTHEGLFPGEHRRFSLPQPREGLAVADASLAAGLESISGQIRDESGEIHVLARALPSAGVLLGHSLATALLDGPPRRLFVYQWTAQPAAPWTSWGPSGNNERIHRRDPYFTSVRSLDFPVRSRHVVLAISVTRDVLPATMEAMTALHLSAPLWSLSAPTPGQNAMVLEDVEQAIRELHRTLQRIQRLAPLATLHVFPSAPLALLIRFGALLIDLPRPVVVYDWSEQEGYVAALPITTAPARQVA